MYVCKYLLGILFFSDFIRLLRKIRLKIFGLLNIFFLELINLFIKENKKFHFIARVK